MPKPEELQSDADYDVYVRSQRSPHCESDRLYKMGSGIGQERRNDTRPATRFGGGFLIPTVPSFQSSPRYDYPIIKFKTKNNPAISIYSLFTLSQS